MSKFLKILWTLVHLLANFVEKVYEIGVQFCESVFEQFTKSSKDKLKSDRCILEENIHHLKKIPQHLAVLLNLDGVEVPSYQNLTNLVYWAFESGINYISFYDYQGILHKNESKFHDFVKKRNFADSELIVWGPEYQQNSSEQKNSFKFPHKNGFKNYIVVNIYSYEDGKRKVSDLMKNELQNADNANHENLTVELVDEKLKVQYGSLPDPDVAVYFGNICSTYGFLPWQIRLTEFFQINHSCKKDLKLNKFINVLYKYAKVEQRFGK